MTDIITQEEIDEGMSLLRGDSVEIEPPRRKIVRHRGKMVEVEEAAYVKFSTAFKKELAELGEHALKVFLYIGLSIGFESGSSHPGVRKIAKDTGMAQNTAAKAVRELEEKEFLTVHRREGASNIYTPIRYISIGRTASQNDAVEEEPPQLDAKPPHENAKPPQTSTVNLHNQINQIKQESPENSKKELSAEEMREIVNSANKAVDMHLALSVPPAGYWQGREFFRDNHLAYADWWSKLTNQVCTKKYMKSWQKAFSDWQDAELKVEHLQESYNEDKKWKTIADPNELTKKAIAIKAIADKRPAQGKVQLDDNGIPINY